MELLHGSNAKFERFNLSFIKSGDGLNKYGTGIYLTDSRETAERYILKGGFLYSVKLYNSATFHEWEAEIEEGLKEYFIRKLNKKGLTREAETMQEECGENGYNMWTLRDLYEIMSHTLTPAVLNEWLTIYGINGIKAENAMLEGSIYVAFDPEDIKILDTEQY
jgi:hypothetical protein